MGQAKRRGSYESRVTQAIREAALRKEAREEFMRQKAIEQARREAAMSPEEREQLRKKRERSLAWMTFAASLGVRI